MCTTVAKLINDSWVLAKTRDPVEWMRWDDEIKLFDTPADACKKLLIQNPDPHEDGYYGGINEYGVAMVATYVGVAENQISYIRRPYVRLILDAKTASEAVEIIKGFNPRIGGNIFVADSNECYGIEAVPDQYYIEKINTMAVKTNHFLHLPHRNLSFDKQKGYESWSKTHQKRAEELMRDVNSIEDMKNLLKDRKHNDKGEAICTTRSEDDCFTYSAFIFDSKNLKAYYAQGNPTEVPFKEYGFEWCS